MKIKRTWFSYFLWFLYTAAVGILLAVHTVLLQAGRWELNRYVAAFSIALCFGLAAGTYLGGRRLLLFLGKKITVDAHSRDMGECFLAMSLFAASILHRLRFTLHVAHNMQWVEIIPQIAFQIFAMFFFYFAIRRTAGRIAALTALCFTAFSPLFTGDIFRPDPQGAYLLVFSAGLWMVARYTDRLKQEGYKKAASYLILLLLGIYIGFAVRLDLLGITLLFFAAMELTAEKKRKKAAFAGLSFAVIAAGTVLTVVLLIFYDSLHIREPFYETFLHWFGQYRAVFGGEYGNFVSELHPAEGIALFFPAAYLIVGFWFDREQNTDGWMFLFLSVLALSLTGVIKINTGVFGVAIGGTMAGLGIRSIGPEEIRTAQKKQENPQAALQKPENIRIIAQNGKENGEEKPMLKDLALEEIFLEPEIKLIENPLPLPKKHVPKEMDYSLDVKKDQMDFDVSVNENDDYDI